MEKEVGRKRMVVILSTCLVCAPEAFVVSPVDRTIHTWSSPGGLAPDG